MTNQQILSTNGDNDNGDDLYVEVFQDMVDYFIGLRGDSSQRLGEMSHKMQLAVGTVAADAMKINIDDERRLLGAFESRINFWREKLNERKRRLRENKNGWNYNELRNEGQDRSEEGTGDSTEEQPPDTGQADPGVRPRGIDRYIWPDKERENTFRADIDG